jgi:Holliday junction resolvase RusA-like endonuclease
VVVKDSEHSKAWRKEMASAAKLMFTGQSPYGGPIEVRAVFAFERSLTAQSGTDPYPIVNAGVNAAGDEDKLERNLLDALQDARVYVNDCQVVRIRTTKIWAGFGIMPGVRVVVLKAPYLTGMCLICGKAAFGRECVPCFLAGELTVSASLGEGAGPIATAPAAPAQRSAAGLLRPNGHPGTPGTAEGR